MKSYSTIEQRIDILQSRIEAYKEEIAVLQAEPKSNNERIIFKFIESRIRIRIHISIIYRSILRTVSDNYKKHTTKGYISSKSSKKVRS